MVLLCKYIEYNKEIMAKPKRKGGPKQQLSPTGRARKAARDVCYAKGWVWNGDTGTCSESGEGTSTSSLQRKEKKAENQRKGQNSSTDLHHVGGKLGNRGDNGDGTKNDRKQR